MSSLVEIAELIPGAFSAADTPEAVPSPSEAVAPEMEPGLETAPETTPSPDPTPDIDTLVNERVAAYEAARQAEAQRIQEQRQEELRLRLRQQEAANAQAFAAELSQEDQALAQRFVQHRSFIEQERDEAFVQRDNSLKALDAAMLVLERENPELMQKVIAQAQTLMPYQTHEEMSNFLTQQSNQTAAKDAVIQQMQAQIDQLTQQMSALGRDPNADRVETRGTGLPVTTTVTDPSKASNWQEWVAAVQAQR